MNTAQEQRQQDILSEVTGSAKREVLSDDVAVELIGLHLQDQEREKEAAANIEHHGSPEPTPPIEQAMAEAPIWVGPIEHPARPQLAAEIAQAAQVARLADEALARSRQLARAGRKNEAAQLAVTASEGKTAAAEALAKAQQILPQLAAEEAQVNRAAYSHFLQGQDAIMRRELGDAWNPQTKAQIKDYLRAQGVSEQELAGLTDARTVLVAADALGIPRGGKVRRDMSAMRAKSEAWRSRREPQGSLAEAISRGEVRAGSMEAAAWQMTTGERLTRDQQFRVAEKRAQRLSPPASVGRQRQQATEGELLARLARVVR